MEKFKIIGRWIAVIPCSILASWIVWILVYWGNSIAHMSYLDPDSFLVRLHIEFVSSVAMSVVFVYCGAKIAPSHNKQTAYVLSVVSLVTIGFLLFPGVMQKEYWALWSGFSGIIGVGVIVYAINTDQVKVSQNLNCL